MPNVDFRVQISVSELLQIADFQNPQIDNQSEI